MMKCTLKYDAMKMRIYPVVFLLLLLTAQCKKETQTVYQVKNQVLYQNSAQKTNLKSTSQFISIAYSDLYNVSITTAELNNLSICLQALGDQATMEDIIIKNLLGNAAVQIPDNTSMRNDIPTFINQTYIRFYNRQPTAEETWKMQALIQQNTDIIPQMVYYSMMTSTEYRYY